ncbi:MAG: hypothetical protein Q8O83_00560 [bacterium]|nr:hypothetical protein [bacterium]
MILTTHVLGAAVLTKPLLGLHPVLLFVGALASHYLLDIIPHRDYKLDAVIREGQGKTAKFLGIHRERLFGDVLKIFIDGAVGAGILFFIIRPEISIVGLVPFGAIVLGAVLPDILQPMFWFFPKGPMPFIHRFHKWVHTAYEPRPFIGFSIQGIFIALSLFILL